MQQRYRRRAPEGMVSGEEFIVIISPHRLVGRERDLSLLRTFVAEAAEDGGALLLTGDAGVGKTALLNVVAAEARRGGTRVLRAAGADFEAALSFAGLSQLLGPVLGQLSELEEIDQRALRVFRGLIYGTASEEQAVAIATSRLLTAVAAVEPGVVLPRVLPLTERLEQLFASRIDHLPASTRDLLLLAVLDGTGDLVVLSPDGDSLDALAPAERARVARMSTTRRAGLPFIIRWSGSAII
jgi:AAA ATPase domain